MKNTYKQKLEKALQLLNEVVENRWLNPFDDTMKYRIIKFVKKNKIVKTKKQKTK